VSEAEQPTLGTWYFVNMASMHSDGTILVPATSSNGEHTLGGMTIVEPDDPNYELWQWVLANRERLPEINPNNATAVYEAFLKSQTVEKMERRVAPDHGLPDL
jgi:hypothetical protein